MHRVRPRKPVIDSRSGQRKDTHFALPMYRFGAFQVDPRARELRKNGARIRLQDQLFQTLLKLLERPGELVTREQLRGALWPADTFVDFDTGLNTVIKRLREALGDSAEVPTYIETVPKRGYRFIAPVESISSERSPDIHRSRKVEMARWLKWAALAAILVAASAAALLYVRRSEAPTGTAITEIVPLTGIAGVEDQPAFSPDGNQVAYTVFDPGKDKFGIYTTVMGGERPLHLTTSPDDCCPVWSHDGRSIAFARGSAAKYTVYTLPVLGGTPRKVYEAEGEYAEHIDMSPVFSWAPDGKSFAVSAPSNPRKQPAIALVSLADSSTRFITSPPPEFSDWSPSFSPDGRFVAFLRSSGPGLVEDLYLIPAAGGEIKRLTFDNRFVASPLAWTPDSREIIFGSIRGGLLGLWRISASGGRPRRVEGVGAPAHSPAVSLQGQRLAYVSDVARFSLRHLRLRDATHVEGVPEVLLASKNELGLPYFSADGRRIVFESSRSGYLEIWTINADGSSEAQLTYLNGISGTPRWSYDGRFVAFDYRPKEHSEIYQIDAAGGTARLVPTIPGADNTVPSWSHDGKWIYFASNRGNEPTQVWKVPTSGGAPVQLTKNGGMAPIESGDGFVYYSKSLFSTDIARVPTGGGEETLVMKDFGHDWALALAPAGIYFISETKEKKWQLMFYEFSTKKRFAMMTFQKAAINPAVTPDGHSLAYVQIDQADSTIMLVSHFR